jgi:hypothetical protein
MNKVFSIYLILSGALCPGVYSPLTEMSTRGKEIIFLGVERGRCVGLTTLLPSVRRLYRQRGILNIKQLYRLPWPVTGIDLLSFFTLRSMKGSFLLQIFC